MSGENADKYRKDIDKNIPQSNINAQPDWGRLVTFQLY